MCRTTAFAACLSRRISYFPNFRAPQRSAREQGKRLQEEPGEQAIGQALTYSREKNLEREAVAEERDTIQGMRAGQNQHAPIASVETRREIKQDHSHLSESQRAAVEQILSRRDQVTALEGVAGAGKTTSLAAIRKAAEREG